MRKFSFSKVAGSKPSTLLKMNFFIGFFKNFDRKFLNNYFPDHLSMVTSTACFVLVLLT